MTFFRLFTACCFILARKSAGSIIRSQKSGDTVQQTVGANATAARSLNLLVGSVRYGGDGDTVMNFTFGMGEEVDWSKEFNLSSDGKTRIKFIKMKRSMKERIFEVIGTIGWSAVLAFVFRRFLKGWPPVDENADPSVLKEWSSGLCGCFADMSSCCCACCCLPVQWADNADRIGFQPFWKAFFLFSILEGFVMFDPSAGCFLIAIVVYLRQEIRKSFDMGRGVGDMVFDILFSCFCMCCVVAQETRHLAEAARLGHQAMAGQRPVLGDAVQVESESKPEAASSEKNIVEDEKSGANTSEKTEEGESNQVEPQPEKEAAQST